MPDKCSITMGQTPYKYHIFLVACVFKPETVYASHPNSYDPGLLAPVGGVHHRHHPHNNTHTHAVQSNTQNSATEDTNDAVLPFPHALFSSDAHASMLAGPSTSTLSLNPNANTNVCVPGLVCQSCGSNQISSTPYHGGLNGGMGLDGTGMRASRALMRGQRRWAHSDLVRTVALGEEFVLSGSYDLSIKVWDRKTGAK